MRYSFPPEITLLKYRVCKLTGVSLHELTGPGRLGYVCRARFALMRVASKKGYSTPQIGRALGGRDHTTILHGLKRAAELSAADREFAGLVRQLARRPRQTKIQSPVSAPSIEQRPA